MAVITILAAVFFGAGGFWISWGLVGFSLLILASLGMLLHHFFFANEHVPFIMELPLYHLPNFRTIGLYVRDNIVGFLKKAGTIILLATLVVWALSYFPSGDVTTSFLSMVGKFLEPIGNWMGLPWRVMVALLTSFVAKENTVATLACTLWQPGCAENHHDPSCNAGFPVISNAFHSLHWNCGSHPDRRQNPGSGPLPVSACSWFYVSAWRLPFTRSGGLF